MSNRYDPHAMPAPTTYDPLGEHLARIEKGHGPKSMRTRLQESIALWRQKVPAFKDPHFAQTVTGQGIKADGQDELLYGPHMSAVFSVGVRTWVFESAVYRDRFVNYYRVRGAKPCGNPYP